MERSEREDGSGGSEEESAKRKCGRIGEGGFGASVPRRLGVRERCMMKFGKVKDFLPYFV